ncbi:UNVERIFIED_CONTAM: hypothetical protein C3P01_01500 [Clostridioides difficile]|uniref:ABC-2 transporter family protein n=1 Tax=Clostridioides difficile TaxID=1496 RepID=UPI00038C714B|nr:ABC-2 transporter family protein [Clostridioides difficile]EQE83479.1 ABC-2 transporter family protein [Clostridioides difficile CD69]OYO89372.1 hypothetical protein B7359_07215 [Clostridioides difficile]HBF7936535.1 hypothetical protein [Clostridioides difficile]HBG6489840.1 hypothetical protein [Clostridioides difficile]HBY2624146.1 hypothetical protein [Clostridioides difficile]
MLNWEIKKILKDKSSILALILMIVSLLIVGFIKPLLETQNEYFDESKNKYVIDNRSKEEIANEKLAIKKEMVKSTIDSPDSDKKLKSISKEKLNLDNGNKYENVDFYKVFTQRIDFPVSVIIMMIIIVMIMSNLYTDEVVANVSPIILSSKQRNKALYSKVIIAILLPIVVYSVYIGATWIITYMQYGAPLNGDLQAYRIIDMAMAAKSMTINQYVLSKVITTTLILLGVSTVSLLVSFLSDNSIKSISISAGFIAVGKVLTQFSFLPKEILSLLNKGNYIDVITGTSKISGFYNEQINILSKTVDMSNLIIIIYALIAIIGLLGCIYTIKKVLTK